LHAQLQALRFHIAGDARHGEQPQLPEPSPSGSGNLQQNNVLGTVELRLQQAIGDPHIFDVTGHARLLPEADPYTSGTVQSGRSVSVITFIGPNIDSRTNSVVFRVATTISATIATQVIGAPSEFVVVFYTASGSGVEGQVKLAGPSR